MEKLAQLPEMELLQRALNPVKFEAWCTRHTGWQIVDACMHYLHYHGWINFRVRAMLVSVATYTLSLPWRPLADWLAHLFVDFESGINYPQIKMQSGMAANPVLRMYNPVTQAKELDPQAHFVRKWVQELQQVGGTWILSPLEMPTSIRARHGMHGGEGSGAFGGL